MNFNKKLKIISIFAAFLLLSSCMPKQTVSNIEHAQQEQTLSLTFAGDIMAHKVNFSMSDYSLIYADIKNVLQSD
ncbi:MAG: CapA family protein, partial [Elusimicrobiota bacterium]|nr:CapA family protein [Elusimicrobiota bacterium]